MKTLHNHRIKSEDKRYIWQQNDWPHWVYNHKRLAPLLTQVHMAQGHLLGRMHDLGLDARDQATLRVLTEDVLKTSEIEGEKLNPDSVHSSIARRLGVDIGALAPTDRHVDGVVDMVLDATQRHNSPLTAERLFGWHAAMFPTGYSSLTKIRVGQWRDDSQGPMQVVSGPIHRQKVHHEVPPAYLLDAQMGDFLNWFNLDQQDDPVIKAGLAHLWFVTVHPFEDGNGRIARAVGDMALARDERDQAWLVVPNITQIFIVTAVSTALGAAIGVQESVMFTIKLADSLPSRSQRILLMLVVVIFFTVAGVLVKWLVDQVAARLITKSR